VIGLAISSLTDRRIVAGAAVIGLFLVTSITSGIIIGARPHDGGSYAGLINVLAMPLYLRDVVFLGRLGDDSRLTGVNSGALLAGACYALVLVAGVALLLRRYRWVER